MHPSEEIGGPIQTRPNTIVGCDDHRQPFHSGHQISNRRKVEGSLRVVWTANVGPPGFGVEKELVPCTTHLAKRRSMPRIFLI